MFFLFCSADSRFFPQMYSSLALQNETQMDNKRKRKRKAERNIKDSHCRRMIDTFIFALSFLLLLLFLSSCRIRPSFTGMHCLSLSRIAFPPLIFRSLFSFSVSLVLCFASFFARVSLHARLLPHSRRHSLAHSFALGFLFLFYQRISMARSGDDYRHSLSPYVEWRQAVCRLRRSSPPIARQRTVIRSLIRSYAL